MDRACYRLVWMIVFLMLCESWILSIDPISPKHSAVFFGWPSLVNNANFDVQLASKTFEDYDILLFGAGLESSTHPDHARTKSLLEMRYQQQKESFLSLSLVQSVGTITSIIDEIKSSGATGVFLQAAEYDAGGVVTRSHQNTAVNYVHSKNMTVAITANTVFDIVNNDVCVANPTGISVNLNEKDYIVLLGYYVKDSQYVSASTWIAESDAIYNFTSITGTKVVALGTVTGSNPDFSQTKFDMVFYSSLLYGWDGVGWGEDLLFSAVSARITLRTTEYWDLNIGTQFTSPVIHDSPYHRRHTTSGWITINTDSNTAEFTWIVCIANCSFRGACHDEGTVNARCECVEDWAGKYCQTYWPTPVISGWLAITLSSIHFGITLIVTWVGFGSRMYRVRKLKKKKTPASVSPKSKSKPRLDITKSPGNGEHVQSSRGRSNSMKDSVCSDNVEKCADEDHTPKLFDLVNINNAEKEKDMLDDILKNLPTKTLVSLDPLDREGHEQMKNRHIPHIGVVVRKPPELIDKQPREMDAFMEERFKLQKPDFDDHDIDDLLNSVGNTSDSFGLPLEEHGSFKGRSHKKQASLSEHPMFWTLRTRKSTGKSLSKNSHDLSSPELSPITTAFPMSKSKSAINAPVPTELQSLLKEKNRPRHRKRYSVSHVSELKASKEEIMPPKSIDLIKRGLKLSSNNDGRSRRHSTHKVRTRSKHPESPRRFALDQRTPGK